MNRFITIILGIALTGLFLLMLPYLLLAGILAIVLLRLLFRRPFTFKRKNSNIWKRRYQQAYARHWQNMTPGEREDFLERNAPIW